MSFSSPLILACLSRPLEAALVSVPNDDRPYLTSWREETQERRGPGGRIARYFAAHAQGLSPLAFCDLNAGPVLSREPSHADIR